MAAAGKGHLYNDSLNAECIRPQGPKLGEFSVINVRRPERTARARVLPGFFKGAARVLQGSLSFMSFLYIFMFKCLCCPTAARLFDELDTERRTHCLPNLS